MGPRSSRRLGNDFSAVRKAKPRIQHCRLAGICRENRSFSGGEEPNSQCPESKILVLDFKIFHGLGLVKVDGALEGEEKIEWEPPLMDSTELAFIQINLYHSKGVSVVLVSRAHSYFPYSRTLVDLWMH